MRIDDRSGRGAARLGWRLALVAAPAYLSACLSTSDSPVEELPEVELA